MRKYLSGVRPCSYIPLRLSRVRVVGAYQGPLRSCIHALKYNGNTRVAEPLGQLLAEGYINYELHADVVIPVPLHSERQQQRGYNHAYLLAQHCAAKIGVPLRNDVLIRHRATPAQVGLNLDERRENVAGAFLCTQAFATSALQGRTILLIDDVYRTPPRKPQSFKRGMNGCSLLEGGEGKTVDSLCLFDYNRQHR